MNYSNTKIYKIWSTQGDKIYIGSTTKQYLSQRMTTHRGNYNSWKNGNRLDKLSSFILFEDYGIDNCFIELLEAKECKDKHEQAQLDGKYIRELECVNKDAIVTNAKEYYTDNKDAILKQKKEYYNKKKILLQQK